jgi:chromosome partitioning protein
VSVGTHRLVLLRHGETEWSKSGQHTSTTDLDLTEHGREQAKLAAQTIGHLGLDNPLVVSSPRKRALDKLDQFDVVIIDCPPSLGVLTLNGLTAADEVIVPLQCETLAHRGVGQFLRTVDDVQQITNPNLKLLGALPTLYDSRTTHSRDVLLDVADRYNLPVLAPPIPRTVRFAEASASGSSVLAGRKSKGSTAYRDLAAALLKHWKSGKALPTFAPEI